MSSSSGEEVEVTENHIVEAGQGKNFHWHNDQVNKLASYVRSKLTPADDLAPYDSVTVDWDDVEEVVGVDMEKCQHKWKLLLNSVRTYRTMVEITLDIQSQSAKTEITKFNKAQHQSVALKTQSQQTKDSALTVIKKKKRKINPDHPKRPKTSGYALFCTEKMKEMTDIKGVALMLKLASIWKELSEPKRIQYNLECAKQKKAYLKKVQEYAKQHPEDTEIKQIVAEEIARVSKSSKKKVVKDVKEQQEPVVADETMNDTVVTNESDSILESPKKTSKKKRHNEEDSQDSSPSKKKKKKSKNEKVWTAEEMYIETRIEGYRLDHTDMDDDDIQMRLMRKFNKLSEEKKAKYKRKAEERNS